MKFTAVLLALASTVLAQGASIGAPAEGSSATTGRNITVMIEQPNSLSSIEQVAIVIGLVHCGSESSCPEPANGLGVILYAGPFDPQYATPPGSLPPHQNLSLQVPETFPVGYAQLGVAHAYLLGAGLYPNLETFSTILEITNTSTTADSHTSTTTDSQGATTIPAQNTSSASIGAPADGSSATTGTNITVMIEQPNSLSSIKQVAIVIGLVHCESESSCPGPTNELGTILYSGSFNPQYATPPGTLPPHQNFSLQVPETFAVGYAQLGVAHMYLLGAGLSPYLETFNTTLMITNTSTAADSQGATKTFSGMRIVGKPRLRQ